jgi:hypothetical protein
VTELTLAFNDLLPSIRCGALQQQPDERQEARRRLAASHGQDLPERSGDNFTIVMLMDGTLYKI